MDKKKDTVLKVVVIGRLEELLKEIIREEILKYEQEKGSSFRDKIKTKETK